MRWIKRIAWVLLILLSPFLLYGLFSVVLSYWPHGPKSLDHSGETHTIYFRSNGVHIDLFLPVEGLSPRLQQGLELPEAVRYVAFGWGDRQFYVETPTWEDMRMSTVAKSLLWHTESAMHVTKYYRRPVYDRILSIDSQQLKALEAYIIETLEWEGDQLVPIGEKGYHEHDRFYETRPGYHCFNTCNIWLGRALKKANIRTSQWSPFVFGILYHLPVQT